MCSYFALADHSTNPSQSTSAAFANSYFLPSTDTWIQLVQLLDLAIPVEIHSLESMQLLTSVIGYIRIRLQRLLRFLVGLSYLLHLSRSDAFPTLLSKILSMGDADSELPNGFSDSAEEVKGSGRYPETSDDIAKTADRLLRRITSSLSEKETLKIYTRVQHHMPELWRVLEANFVLELRNYVSVQLFLFTCLKSQNDQDSLACARDANAQFVGVLNDIHIAFGSLQSCLQVENHPVVFVGLSEALERISNIRVRDISTQRNLFEPTVNLGKEYQEEVELFLTSHPHYREVTISPHPKPGSGPCISVETGEKAKAVKRSKLFDIAANLDK